MKILMICCTFPYPPTRGGTQGRTFNLLNVLTRNHEITLVTHRSPEVSAEDIQGLKQFVKELVTFERPKETETQIFSKINNYLQFLLQGTPPNVRYLHVKEMQNWLDQAVATKQYDVITCEHSANEIYIRPQWKNEVKTVLNIHSSVYLTCYSQLATGTSENPQRDRLYLPLLRRYEKKTLSKFSQIVVTTDNDQEQMQAFNPNLPIFLVPNGVDLETFPYRTSDPNGHHLMFVGGLDYVINIDAVCFFAEDVFPKLQAKYPDITLTLVGSKPAPKVQALAKNPSITVTGRVPSVAEYLHKATVAVIPMRTGFGMKFKTLESMAAGVPVVASDRGLEGLEVDTSNVPLRALRANTVEEYIERISQLFDDQTVREKLSFNGRQLIEEQYTWEHLGQLYESVIVDEE
ncbi:MAG: glycosyltransferase family 4 protein [Microcystaceae cyanobacterium]